MNKQGNESDKSGGIEWTHVFGPGTGVTWNPIGGCRHGCVWEMPDGSVAECYAKSAMYEASRLRRANADGWRLNIYHCKFCRHYHIGHAPGG